MGKCAVVPRCLSLRLLFPLLRCVPTLCAILHGLTAFAGTGESGKSTIAKQMKIIHLNGFTDEERKLYTNAIHNNVYLSMRSMIQAAREINAPITISEVIFSSCFPPHVCVPALAPRIDGLSPSLTCRSRRSEFLFPSRDPL